MTDNVEKKSTSKGVLFFFATISIILVLISGFFLLKQSADAAFINNFISALSLHSDLDKEILNLETELKKDITKEDPYNKDNFSDQVELLQAFNNGYLTLEDLEKIGLELPQVQILFFHLGFHKIMMNEKQQKVLGLATRLALKKMTKEDFGDDIKKWREWQNQKDQ